MEWRSSGRKRYDSWWDWNAWVGNPRPSEHSHQTPTRQYPNAKQLAALTTFTARLLRTRLEEHERKAPTNDEQPLFDYLLKNTMGWKHGVQFVRRAFLNAMPAAIKGNTTHYLSGIPAGGASKRRSNSADTDKLRIRCQSQEWILIDEVSMTPTKTPR